MILDALRFVFFSVSSSIGFLLLGCFVFNWLCLAQEKYGTQIKTRADRRRARSSYFYRGAVRGGKSNAEWFVDSLLNAHDDTRGTDDRRFELPPEWENYYASRKVPHDHDKSGTTVKLSTADMINVRWNLPLNVCLELGLFADLIVKDFILFWYNESISQEPQFPDDVRSVLQNVLGRLGDRVLSVNLPMFLLCDMTYVLRHHLRWFSELRIRARKRCHPAEEFDKISQDDRNKLLLEEFRRAGHLHPACSLIGQSEDPRTLAYVRSVTCELLVRLLPEEDYHCAALRHLVREVLTCNVLVPALESVTPDVLNTAILAALRGENENSEEEQQEETKEQTETCTATATSADSNNTTETELLEEEMRYPSSSLDHEEHSISFIEEASSEMRKEEVSRLLVELHSSLAECVSTFTSNPDVALGNDCSEARQLLRVLDTIFSHGLLAHSEPVEGGGITCEPWWEFIRHVSEILPSTSMSVDAVDSVVEVLAMDHPGENEADVDASAPRLLTSSKKTMRQIDFEKDILQPGKAWLAMVLKHNLLAEAIQALLNDKSWTDLHFIVGATIRSERLVPTLATLNGIEFDFDLDKFWEHSSKLRKKLDLDGVKPSKHAKLRRMRKRLAEKLSSNIKRRGGDSKIKHERAIIALQDRVGPVQTKIESFTVKKERGVRTSSFVQYVIKCALTRRVDGKVSHWIIYRRYNKFHDLHASLRSHYGQRFDDLSLPKKGGFHFGSQSVSFINKRKAELEEYLTTLLSHPAVCDSEQVLTFLSPQTEEEFLSENEVEGQQEQFKPVAEGSSSGGSSKFATTKKVLPLKKTKQAIVNKLASVVGGGKPKEPSIDPTELQIAEGHIYRLAQEVFEFHELGMFKRNLIAVTRSVVSILFQGTAHRWLKDNYTRSASADLLAKLLAVVRELLWGPDGEFIEAEEEEEISPEEITRMRKTRDECLEEMIKAIPPSMIRFLGLEKSHACCRKLHEFLQHPQLIHNLVFTTMDLLVMRLWEDIPLKDIHNRKYDLG